MIEAMPRIALALALLGSLAHADPILLRMAAIAPDGTEWARQARAFANDVEQATQGQVKMKWYLGGIAGDENAVVERIRRGQLDGAAGVTFCSKLAPSLLAAQLIGLVQSRDEYRSLLARLRPRVDEEFARAGFINLGLANFGVTLPFVRERVASFDELKRRRLFVWSDEAVLPLQLPAMGLNVVPLPLEDARGAADAGKIDGFVTIPSAALGFQWSTRVRWFLPGLPLNVQPACLIVAPRAFDRLPTGAQVELRAAGARASVRFEAAGHRMDDALTGGLFEKQGLKPLPVSDSFRAGFFNAMRTARDATSARLVDPDLLRQVQTWLADYRAEHGRSRGP